MKKAPSVIRILISFILQVTPPQTADEMKNPWLRLEIVAEIDSPRFFSIPYFHSFFLTENYIIFPEQPWLTGDVGKMLFNFVFLGKGIGDTMTWDPNAPLKFHVLQKSTGKLSSIQYESDPMGFFHIGKSNF